ncbi:hypothetical protein EVAR_5165_1 [Eumeta japonica]|uniref:Uncharacterized protein n=1 Tax=Eumeta variegata TaxID=151549 RepID=A0A4C1SVG1_EUMVA|nr:hypothetical protein EVAR_5165_1 [Eumeta japonica]
MFERILCVRADSQSAVGPLQVETCFECGQLRKNVKCESVPRFLYYLKMVRTYKPKTEKHSLDEERIKTAVSEVTFKVLLKVH